TTFRIGVDSDAAPDARSAGLRPERHRRAPTRARTGPRPGFGALLACPRAVADGKAPGGFGIGAPRIVSAFARKPVWLCNFAARLRADAPERAARPSVIGAAGLADRRRPVRALKSFY